MAPQRQIIHGLNPTAPVFVPRSVHRSPLKREERKSEFKYMPEKPDIKVIKTPAQNNVSIPKSNPWNANTKQTTPRVLSPNSNRILSSPPRKLSPELSPDISSFRKSPTPTSGKKGLCVILRGLPCTGKLRYAAQLRYTLRKDDLQGIREVQIRPTILHDKYIDKHNEFSRALTRHDWLIVVVGVHEKVIDYEWMLEKAGVCGYETKLIEFRPNYEQIDKIFKNEISIEMQPKFLMNCQSWEPDQRAILKAPYRPAGWDRIDNSSPSYEEELKQNHQPSPPFHSGRMSPPFVDRSSPPFVGEQYLLGDDASVCSVDSGSSESSYMYDTAHQPHFELYPIRERSYLKPL